MIHYHGNKKKHSFFEGWYLKHQNDTNTICFIPSCHIDERGQQSACIQVITDKASYSFDFKAKDFSASENRFHCKIGSNIFSNRGIEIHLCSEALSIDGSLQYGSFIPLKSDIMGPFSLLPFLQCNHGILSLTHKLKGSLSVNGELLDFNEGTGYIEKDWGSSFPKQYLWTQCNWAEQSSNCIMLSIAHIPFCTKSFTGCISSIYYNGKEYRLATYLGVKILKYTNREVILLQGHFRLQIKLLKENPFSLNAPNKGNMNKTIHESPSCKVGYRFWEKDILLFQTICRNASFEYAENLV